MIKLATIILPIPSKKLSPNARVHWAVKAETVEAHRRLAALETFNQIGPSHRFKSYRLHFYWPDNRVRDGDNGGSRCKAFLDGVADCIGQDDSEWQFDGVRFNIDSENPRLEIVFK